MRFLAGNGIGFDKIMDTEAKEFVRVLMVEVAAHGVPDYEARGMARDALQIIQSHERICLERSTNADEQRERIEDKVNSIVSLQRQQMLAVIGILVAALAFFLIPYFQHR